MMIGVVSPMIWIALFPLLALVPALIASQKGYPFFVTWLLSIVFPPVALVVVLLLPVYKVCEYCLEPIKAKASACRYCGRWQDAAPDPLTHAPLYQAPQIATLPARGLPEMGRVGEKSPELGTDATETAFAANRDDRRDRSNPARRVKEPSNRRMAVAGGLLTVAILIVLTLPEIRGLQWRSAELAGGTADATPVVPLAQRTEVPAASGRGMPVELRARHVDDVGTQATAAAPEPAGTIGPAAPPGIVPVRATVSVVDHRDARGPAALLETQTSATEDDSNAFSGSTSTQTLASPTDAQTTTLTPDAVRRVQAMLTELGYDAGPVDGVMGAKTKDALRRYRATGARAGENSRKLPHLPPAASLNAAADVGPAPISLLPKDLRQAKP